MTSMIVRELIEILEEVPQDYPVVADDVEVTEVLIREEVYFDEDRKYNERKIIKIN